MKILSIVTKELIVTTDGPQGLRTLMRDRYGGWYVLIYGKEGELSYCKNFFPNEDVEVEFRKTIESGWLLQNTLQGQEDEP